MAQEHTLQTTRLDLRWFRPGDEDTLLTIYNDPAFIRHVGDRGIRSHAQARAALEGGALALYESHGYGPYRLALRDNDELVGLCGLFQRPYLEHPDIGFAVLPAHRRHGLALEASRAVLDHARTTLQLPRVTAIVTPDHAASIALLEKLGLRLEQRLTPPGETQEICVFARDLGA